MKLLFDQNISHRILKYLPKIFENSSSIKNEKLINRDDRYIWNYAKVHNFTIVTQDSDFSDLNIFLGFPPKIIWLKTGNLSTKSLSLLIYEYQDELIKFSENPELGCFEILSIPKSKNL